MKKGQIKIPGEAPTWASNLTSDIQDWVLNILRAPVLLPSFTVAQLGSLPASNWINCAVICSNESGGRTIATSDGTNWLRVKDGAVVS